MRVFAKLKMLTGRTESLPLKKLFSSVLALIFFGLTSAYSQSADIAFSPSSGSFLNGSTFVVNVDVHFNAGASIDVADLHFDFDKTKLAVVSATNSPSTAILPNVAFPLESPATMNTNGRINYVAGTSSNFPTTDFTVISVTFQAIATGTAVMTFRRPPTPNPNTNLIRSSVNILAGVTNASYNITNCTPPTATIANTGTCNGQPFAINLASATGTGPFSLVVNGTTYNNISVGGQVTTFTPPTSTIFGNTVPASNDELDEAVTLGMKFSSSVPGFIKGVRFFSNATPTGTFTGQLWSNTGTLLANVTFSSVTGHDWQQALFSSPVLITANTTYIVSYRTSTGSYTATSNGLTTGVTSGTLTAPSSGTSGGNGVYTYDNVDGVPAPHFPVSTFQDASYWVDVVFVPSQYTIDLTSVTDNGGCANVGAPLQSLSVTSVDCSTLPVTLLNLSATPVDKKVVLHWSTATELDNTGFEIQRSTASSTWEGIGFVNGAGNSSVLTNYTYTDYNLFSNRYYYRLKQVDIDGHYKYSMVVTAVIDGKEETSMTQNYPNPFRGMTTIQYTLPQKTQVSITVFDMNGRTMKVLVNGVKEAGNHAQNFYSGALPAGMYYYQIQAGAYKAVKKMVIQ